MKRPGPRYTHRHMVRLDDDMWAALEAEVVRSGIPGAEITRKALDFYLAATPPPNMTGDDSTRGDGGKKNG